MKFKDEKYKSLGKEAIAAKLKQINEFESKYKPNSSSIGMRKWCTDYNYRKREWEWRQSLSNYIISNNNVDYR
jgi:hypothetical protein